MAINPRDGRPLVLMNHLTEDQKRLLHKHAFINSISEVRDRTWGDIEQIKQDLLCLSFNRLSNVVRVIALTYPDDPDAMSIEDTLCFADGKDFPDRGE